MVVRAGNGASHTSVTIANGARFGSDMAPGSTQRQPTRTSFVCSAVAILSLFLVAYPAIVIAMPQIAGPMLIGVAAALAPLVIGRLSEVKWPAMWLFALGLAYGISNQFEKDQSQGFKHTVTLACIGLAFLAFATYGADIYRYKWFRISATVLVFLDIVAAIAGGLPKNATGGALIYICSFAVIGFCRRSEGSGWLAALLLSSTGFAISLILNFRFMLVCSVVFLLAFIGATKLRHAWYWAIGIFSASTLVSVVIWFFLTFDNRGLAWRIGQTIATASGHRANSGRDEIWPYLLYAIQQDPWLGLGAGALPRDLFSTEFSAHNYYMQVYLQLGLAGLLLTICLLLAVWRPLAYSTSTAGRLGSAVFIMFVVHNATEVLLLQNNAFVAVPAWCGIGLALAIDREHRSRGERGSELCST